MCIFLCLGNSCLLHIVCCKPFTKGIGNRNLVECHFLVRDRRIIVREAYIDKIKSCTSVKALEIIIAECSRNLSCSVRSEVKEDYGILILDGCNRLTVLYNYSRLYKFVCLISVIGSLDACRTAFCGKSLSLCQRIISKLYSVIVIISVHCVITSCYRSNFTYTDLFHFSFQLLGVFFSACRRCITSI